MANIEKKIRMTPRCEAFTLKFDKFDDLHFVEYVAYRSSETGSIFIRTLVATFYKLAGQMDVERLSKMVKSSITSHASRSHSLHNE